MADDRGRRRRADRRRARRTDPRARDAQPAGRVPNVRSRDGARAARRRRQGAARDVRRRPLGAGRGQLEKLGVELRMGARVTNIDASGVDVQTERRHRAHRRAHRRLGRRRAGVAARREARRRDRRRGRPRRAHRDASRSHAARPPRGVRRRRHGDARRPAGRRRGRDARKSARGEHHRPPAARRARSAAVQLPRPRQRRGDRTLPRDLQRPRAPAQRLPGVGRLAVRAPRVPQRLREPLHDGVAMAALDGRPRTAPNGCSASRTPAATSAPRTRCARSSNRTSSPRPRPRPIRPRPTEARTRERPPEPSRARWFAVLALAVALVLVAAACGGDDDDTRAAPDRSPARRDDAGVCVRPVQPELAVEVVRRRIGGHALDRVRSFTRDRGVQVRHDDRLDRLQQLHGHVRPREQRRDQVRRGRCDEGPVPRQPQRAGARA